MFALSLLLLLGQAAKPAQAPPAPHLIITDLSIGRGNPAAIGDELTVDYTGKLKNGKVFDSSKGPGRKPFKLILGFGQVIKGWDEGLIGARVGGKRMLIIPPELGYGDRDNGPIPAKSSLTFVVDIVAIKHLAEEVKITTTKQGSGPGATFGDTLAVHYRGKLTTGKEFDNSYDRGAPLQVTIGKTPLIPGFTFGLLGMKKGERRTIKIPSDLAYGDTERGPIPAKSNLVFELELVNLTPAVTTGSKK